MGTGLEAVDLGTNITATSVAAGNDHTCAALGDGSLKVRGRTAGRQTAGCRAPFCSPKGLRRGLMLYRAKSMFPVFSTSTPGSELVIAAVDKTVVDSPAVLPNTCVLPSLMHLLHLL